MTLPDSITAADLVMRSTDGPAVWAAMDAGKAVLYYRVGYNQGTRVDALRRVDRANGREFQLLFEGQVVGVCEAQDRLDVRCSP